MTSTIHSYLQPGTGIAKLAAPASASSAPNAESSSGLGFRDLLDIVNPLQHIPVIGHIYRSISGDTIHPIMKIAGGALFGGPIGAIVSAATLALTSDKEESVIPAGGVDPATVANTYPFGNPAGQAIDPAHSGHSLSATTGILPRFSNDIPNPVVIAKMQARQARIDAEHVARVYQEFNIEDRNRNKPLTETMTGEKTNAG